MVTVEGAGAVSRADADLDIEPAVPGVPHPAQPGEAVPGLRPEGCRCPVAEHPLAEQQQHIVVGRAMGELQIVAGVVPAARDVDPATERVQVLVGDGVGAGDEMRPGVHPRAPVVEVSGPAVEGSADDVRAVALHLVEPHAVVQQRAVDRLRAGDAEERRPCRDLATGDEAVSPGLVQVGEREVVDGVVARVPPAHRLVRRAAAPDHRAARIDDDEPFVPQTSGGHQPCMLDFVGQITQLVKADPRLGVHRRGRARRRGAGRRGRRYPDGPHRSGDADSCRGDQRHERVV